MSFVVKRLVGPSERGRGSLVVLVPWHRASSEAVAWGELPCSFLLEVSELVPAQPTARRRTAHPIRKATTKAMLRPWRTTAHPPSLCMCPLLLAPESMPHNEPRCTSKGLIHLSA